MLSDHSAVSSGACGEKESGIIDFRVRLYPSVCARARLSHRVQFLLENPILTAQRCLYSCV